MLREKSTSLALLVLLALAYFGIFWQLDTMPIKQWDESRFAINALEMYEAVSLHGLGL